MSPIIKIRIASKTDSKTYIKMLKDIKTHQAEKIIEEDSCVVYYDSKTKIIAYTDNNTIPETFNDLKIATVEDFYYNCKTDYNIYFFENEEKIKELYINWFDRKIYNQEKPSINEDIDCKYNRIISELKTKLKPITPVKQKEIFKVTSKKAPVTKKINYDEVISELKTKLKCKTYICSTWLNLP